MTAAGEDLEYVSALEDSSSASSDELFMADAIEFGEVENQFSFSDDDDDHVH